MSILKTTLETEDPARRVVYYPPLIVAAILGAVFTSYGAPLLVIAFAWSAMLTCDVHAALRERELTQGWEL